MFLISQMCIKLVAINRCPKISFHFQTSWWTMT